MFWPQKLYLFIHVLKRKNMTKLSVPWLPPPLLHFFHSPRIGPRLGLTDLSNEVSNIDGHVLNGCIVEGLLVPRGPLVFFCHYVDCHTLMARISIMTESVGLVFPVYGKVTVDDWSNLLHFSPSGPCQQRWQLQYVDGETGGRGHIVYIGSQRSKGNIPALLQTLGMSDLSQVAMFLGVVWKH